jgi:hypothetical protein
MGLICVSSCLLVIDAVTEVSIDVDFRVTRSACNQFRVTLSRYEADKPQKSQKPAVDREATSNYQITSRVI